MCLEPISMGVNAITILFYWITNISFEKSLTRLTVNKKTFYLCTTPFAKSPKQNFAIYE